MIPTLLSLPIVLLLYLGFSQPLRALTQDLGRHLITGKIIVETHHVPKINLFSYTNPTFPFINHHYLSEVIFYLVYRATGLQGLFFLTLLLIFTTFFLMYLFSYKRTSLPAVFVASLFYLPILFERTDTRPELFSFLYLVLFLILLIQFIEKPTKSVYLLVLLSLIWANSHIYFFLGPTLVFLFFLTRLFTDKWRLTESVKTLFFVTVLTGLVTCINPNGITGALYPLHVFSNYGYQIEENQSVFFIFHLFHTQSIWYFYVVVLCLSLLLITFAKKTKPYEWVLFIFFTLVGASAVRNLPLFVFGTFLLFAKYLFYFLTSISKAVPGRKTVLTTISISLVIAFFCLQFVQTLTKVNTTESPQGVVHAADFFLKEKIPGPLFNNFDIGSYLDFRFYPTEKVFVDGRPEAYPASFFQNVYVPMQEDPELFAKYADYYHINSIFFSHTDQTPWGIKFLSFITSDPHWKLIYLNDTIIILVRNTVANERLIKQFGMTDKTIHESDVDRERKQDLRQLVRFYGLINDTPNIIRVLKDFLTIAPDDCQALTILTNIYIQQNNPAANVYTSQLEKCR